MSCFTADSSGIYLQPSYSISVCWKTKSSWLQFPAHCCYHWQTTLAITIPVIPMVGCLHMWFTYTLLTMTTLQYATAIFCMCGADAHVWWEISAVFLFILSVVSDRVWTCLHWSCCGAWSDRGGALYHLARGKPDWGQGGRPSRLPDGPSVYQPSYLRPLQHNPLLSSLFLSSPFFPVHLFSPPLLCSSLSSLFFSSPQFSSLLFSFPLLFTPLLCSAQTGIDGWLMLV